MNLQTKHYSIAILITLLAIVLIVPSVQASLKDKLKSCIDEKKGTKVEHSINKRIRVECQPMIRSVLKGCHNRDTKTQDFILKATKGWKINAQTALFTITSRNWYDRTSSKIKLQNSDEVIVTLHCKGHGCDGKGRVWIEGDITATEEKQISIEDYERFQSECIDKLVK